MFTCFGHLSRRSSGQSQQRSGLHAVFSISQGCRTLQHITRGWGKQYATKDCRWSIDHQRHLAIALCSGLLLSFRTFWSPAVSVLLQCLASNCCEAGLSFSSPAGSRSGLGAWCWLPEGVSDPAPLPPHYLLGHWFLSRSLQQIFI